MPAHGVNFKKWRCLTVQKAFTELSNLCTRGETGSCVYFCRFHASRQGLIWRNLIQHFGSDATTAKRYQLTARASLHRPHNGLVTLIWLLHSDNRLRRKFSNLLLLFGSWLNSLDKVEDNDALWKWSYLECSLPATDSATWYSLGRQHDAMMNFTNQRLEYCYAVSCFKGSLWINFACSHPLCKDISSSIAEYHDIKQCQVDWNLGTASITTAVTTIKEEYKSR